MKHKALTTNEWYGFFGLSPENRAKLETIRKPRKVSLREVYTSLYGKEMPSGVHNLLWKLDIKGDRYFLKFDTGIGLMAESAQKALLQRGKGCSDVEKQGWAGQFAFDSYLQDIRVQRLHDNPLYSPNPDDCDFRITLSGQGEKRFEVKTTQYDGVVRYKDLRVYYNKIIYGERRIVWKKPDYVVAIKCIEPNLTLFEICGWATGETLERLKGNKQYYQCWEEGCRWGISLADREVLLSPKDLQDMLTQK